MPKKQINVVLLSILLLAFVVRVFKLDITGFWLVEAKIVSFAKHSWSELFGFTLMYRPVYLLLAKLWIGVVGTKEVMVRLLPVILGTGTVAAIYLLAKELWNKNAGVFAAFIMAVSCVHVVFAREARADFILMTLLVMFSQLMMLRIFKKDRLNEYFYLFFINVLILFTNPYGVFWIITQQVCYFVYSKKNDNKRWLLTTTIISFVIILWYFFVLSYSPEIGISWFKSPAVKDIFNTYEAFSCGGAKLKGTGFASLPGAFNMVIPRILMLVYTLCFVGEVFFSSVNYKKNMLICWLVIPIVLAYGYSRIFTPIYMYRYLLFASPAYYLLVARFLTTLRLKLRSVFIIIIVLLSFFTLSNIYKIDKEQAKGFREGIAFLKENIKEGDTIIICPAEMLTVFMYYYDYDNPKILGRIDDELGLKTKEEWVLDFFYKGNRIIGIPFSLLEDFSQDYDFESLSFAQESNIWFVNSPDWPLNENAVFLAQFFKNRYITKEDRFFDYHGFYIKHLTLDE
ncbi:MAG: glycosyltransferase family 39 protein [Candidatus Omnitrophota bacterium]